MQVPIKNVAQVADLCYDLGSLPPLITNGHVFKGHPTGVVDRLTSKRAIVFSLSGTLFSLYGYRVDISSRENACDILALGQPPKYSTMNINGFHCAAGHPHEVLFRKTAEHQRIVIEG